MLYRQRISFSTILFLLLWGCFIHVCQANETIPVHTVLEKIPTFIHMNMEENILGFTTGSKIYVYDLVTGKRRWWKPCKYKGDHYRASFGKDYVVMFNGEQLVALDKASGNELWQKEMGDWQHIEHGYCCNDNWFFMYCEDGKILYNLDAQKGYRIPFEEYSSWGVMPDSETLYELRHKKSKSFCTSLDVMVWKPGELQATKQFSLESHGELIVWGQIGGQFLVSDFLYKRTPEHILRTHDAKTGEIIREFDPDLTSSISLNGLRHISRNTGSFIWTDKEEPHYLHKLDIATGNASAIAIPEGFTVSYSDFTTDMEGNVWFLAWDKDYSLFLLPFNHDGAPRKLLDGNRFLPSHYSMLRPPYLVAYHYAKDYHTILYRLDNMQILAEWPGDAQYLRISEDAQYGALKQREEDGPARIENTYMYSREKDEPLLKVKGSPLAVSPDGRYLVVILEKGGAYSRRRGVSQEDYDEYLQKNSNENNTVHVVDVKTKEAVLSYDLNSPSQARAFFSENGQYLVLNQSGVLTILDIEAGFSEKVLSIPGKERVGIYSICFSPDDKQLLTSGYGQADIFDVATGKHISTFKETSKIIPDYKWQDRNPDFMKRLENKVRNFVGQYTDRLKDKRIPSIYAKFAKNGGQVITVAESRLIRVWDTETGRLIRTIEPELPETRDSDGMIGNVIILSDNGAYALSYNRRGLDSGTLWDLEKGIKIRCYTFEGTQRMSAALSEDGRRVYALIDDDLHYLAGANK
nr:hypothetical protein 5 [Candidatus Hydrogenedentota bacterium]